MVGLEVDLRTNKRAHMALLVTYARRCTAVTTNQTMPTSVLSSETSTVSPACLGCQVAHGKSTRELRKSTRDDLSDTVITCYLLLRFLGRVLPKSVCRALSRRPFGDRWLL